MMKAGLIIASLLGAALLAGCERPPVQSTQNGPRGSGMAQIDNPRIDAALKASQAAVPDLPPPGSNDGPKAKDVYQNVKVLGDLSVGEFTRHMLAITAWVAPQQGCTYCHGANLADDSLYTKVVARRMIEMNRHLNVDWAKHVGGADGAGVTCYTCHRGQPVPANIHFQATAAKNNRTGPGMGNDTGQNKAEPSIALASLPYDPFTPYLKGDNPIRVQTTTALPTGSRISTKQAEVTYSLMNHMSNSLGVNCTFCHNTQSFQSWNGPAQRVTAYHGIRMARDLNTAYLEPLTKTFPANRLGPGGDVAKVNCATCHQGVNKPLGGLAMAKDWPGLMTTALQAPAAAVAPAAPVAVAAPAAVAAAAPMQPLKEVVYFPVNSPLLKGDEVKKIDKLLAALNAQPDSTATISGYHSATGKLAANQALAKQRAFKIRDALVAAGVAASRIKLDKPQQAEANIKGEDPFARRVEVTVK
jgi:photosynthetic reaction center cytochrome c subunit